MNGNPCPTTLESYQLMRETSWMTDKLVFQDEPLAKVVAELNRYSERRIVIADADIADDPVSGSFRTDDVEESVRAIVAYGIAQVGEETGQRIELKKSASGG